MSLINPWNVPGEPASPKRNWQYWNKPNGERKVVLCRSSLPTSSSVSWYSQRLSIVVKNGFTHRIYTVLNSVLLTCSSCIFVFLWFLTFWEAVELAKKKGRILSPGFPSVVIFRKQQGSRRTTTSGTGLLGLLSSHVVSFHFATDVQTELTGNSHQQRKYCDFTCTQEFVEWQGWELIIFSNSLSIL